MLRVSAFAYKSCVFVCASYIHTMRPVWHVMLHVLLRKTVEPELKIVRACSQHDGAQDMVSGIKIRTFHFHFHSSKHLFWSAQKNSWPREKLLSISYGICCVEWQKFFVIQRSRFHSCSAHNFHCCPLQSGIHLFVILFLLSIRLHYFVPVIILYE